VLEGILWILRSGARWYDLPEEPPSPATCWRRLRDWEEQEVWLEIWRAFLSEQNEREQLQWSESFLDGSFAPAKKGAAESEKPSGVREAMLGLEREGLISTVLLSTPRGLAIAQKREGRK
jgi:hypothetical protein